MILAKLPPMHMLPGWLIPLVLMLVLGVIAGTAMIVARKLDR